MTASVTYRLDQGAINSLLRGQGGPVMADLRRRAERVRADAVRRCPVDTGNLRASISIDFVVEGSAPVARVGTTVRYARWVHDGRGPIVPVRARMLAWQRPRGTWHFARRVGPMRGRPFLRDALPAASW